MTVTPRKLSLQGKEGKLKKMEAKNIVQDVKLMVRGKKSLFVMPTVTKMTRYSSSYAVECKA